MMRAIFRHTCAEPKMWRGWLRNGQCLELCRGRCTIGLRVLIHSNDDDMGDRMLNVSLGFAQAFIPLGISRKGYAAGDEPSWGIDASNEFGLNLHWGERRQHFDWPWSLDFYRRSFLLADGTWRHETNAKQIAVNRAGREAAEAYHRECWDARELRWREDHPYRYVLRSGEVQDRTATISVSVYEWRRRWLGWSSFGAKVRKWIDVEFSDEVGERSGSWKGGTVGCSYDMLPGEEPVDTLRRMERERKF